MSAQFPSPLEGEDARQSRAGEGFAESMQAAAVKVETQRTPHPFFASRKMSSPTRGEGK